MQQRILSLHGKYFHLVRENLYLGLISRCENKVKGFIMFNFPKKNILKTEPATSFMNKDTSLGQSVNHTKAIELLLHLNSHRYENPHKSQVYAPLQLLICDVTPQPYCLHTSPYCPCLYRVSWRTLFS